MNKAYIFLLILLSVCAQLMPMEIVHTIQGPKENTALVKQKTYPQYDVPLVISAIGLSREESNRSSSWIDRIGELPKELRAMIYENLFNTNQTIATNLASITTRPLLQSFHQMKQYCPLRVGNKTFTVLEMLALNRTQREEIITIHADAVSDSEKVRIIKSLPLHMKQKMKLTVREETATADLCTHSPVHNCCGIGLCVGTCSSSIIPCCIGGCKTSPLWWIPGGTVLGCCVVLPFSWIMMNHMMCAPKTTYIFSSENA